MRYGNAITTWLTTIAAFAFLGLVLPGDASAQGKFSFAGQGGMAVAAGQVADLTDVGASVGGGVAYWITPRVAVRGDFDANLLPGHEGEAPVPEAPDMNLLHYNGGVEVQLTDPQDSPWNVNVNVGGGATTIDTDQFQDNGGAPVDFNETYLALNGGLGVGYDVNRNVAVFLDGQYYLTVTDEEDTAVFNAFTPDAEAEGFERASVFPVTLGLRIRTN